MMSGYTLRLGPGSGVVASFGAVALLVADGPGPSDLLMTTLRDAAASGPTPGRRVARKLAGLLTDDAGEDLPAFGVLAVMDDGLLVFLSGAVEASITNADESVTRLSGAEAATWVDRVLPTGTGPVELCFLGAAERPGPTSFELQSGVVPGGWIRLMPGDSSAEDVVDPTGELSTVPPPPDSDTPTSQSDVPTLPPPAPQPTPAQTPTPEPEPEPASEAEDEPDPEFESIVLTADRSTLREPLPQEGADRQPTTDDVAADDEADDADLVAGILCSRQHFNSPDSGYCSACGISMVHQTHNLVHRPRPPLGFLVFDDGSTFTLDGRYVFGREPEIDPLVQSGEARAITLDDPEMSISRVHAELRLVDWNVQLLDRGSTNGSHIWDAAANTWVRLLPNEPHVVQPGAHAAVGQRTFVYESPHRR